MKYYTTEEIRELIFEKRMEWLAFEIQTLERTFRQDAELEPFLPSLSDIPTHTMGDSLRNLKCALAEVIGITNEQDTDFINEENLNKALEGHEFLDFSEALKTKPVKSPRP